MKREYPEGPVVAVAAVIFFEGSVLLARRNQEPGKGQWSLPGGAVELGESLLEALKRTGGNKSEAARILGVSRVTLWKWLKAYDIRVDKKIKG
mgnify:CR=1 FL=1